MFWQLFFKNMLNSVIFILLHFRLFRILRVKVSKSFLSNSFSGLSKSATIINIIYLYIVNPMTKSEIKFDQNDFDTHDTNVCLFLILVDSILLIS